ncbi:hypothetical protein EPN87_02925 [archaeon]|nr:MAG: hypothetical protein EPN87_02925 [archaeon]
MKQRPSEKAIELVMRWEKSQGRNPIKLKEGCDIVSSGRHIEVKSKYAKRPTSIGLSFYNMREFRKFKRYFLYVVFLQKWKKPKLLIFNKSDIKRKFYVYKVASVEFNKRFLDKSIEIKN